MSVPVILEKIKKMKGTNYDPMLFIDLSGYGELTAFHDWGDCDEPVVWRGTLTYQEMLELRDLGLISSVCTFNNVIRREANDQENSSPS